MKTCQLNTGQAMPMLGLGLYQVPVAETAALVQEAIGYGYRLFDTAHYYSNEAGVGQAIRASAIPREEFFVTSKLSTSGYLATKRQIDRALDVMQLDYLDLMLLHWQVPDYLGTYRAMEEAQRQGKLRAIGLSNFGQKQIEEVLAHSRMVPAVLQNECHLFHQQGPLRDYCRSRGIQFEAWAPLVEGRRQIFQHPGVAAIAQRYGKTVAQILLAFLVQEGIVVIPQTMNAQHLQDNLASVQVALTEVDMALLRSYDEGQALFGME